MYVPLEAVASKWYGESERNLSEIFRAAEQLGGAIVFLDEIDSLATQRRWLFPCLPTQSLGFRLSPAGPLVAVLREAILHLLQMGGLCLTSCKVFLFPVSRRRCKVLCRFPNRWSSTLLKGRWALIFLAFTDCEVWSMPLSSR